MLEKTEMDLEKDNRQRIADNIKFLLKKPGKSRRGFVEFCKNKYNYNINEGNISKRVNGQIAFGPMLLAYFCEYLEVNMEQVCFERLNSAVSILQRSYIGNDLMEKFSVEKENLDKYYGNYHCYFFPTIKDEKGIIQGTFTIDQLNDEPYARVELVLNIPNKKKGRRRGKTIIKKYEGIMLISSKLSVCYCIIYNAEMGECNFMTFRFNRTLNTVKNQGGLVAVCTVSAGHEKVPTVHRMLLCRSRLKQTALKKLLPCLYLNRSDIVIEERKLQEVIKEFNLDEAAEKCIMDNIRCKDLCVISESVLEIPYDKDPNAGNKWEFISGVRENAYNAKYNKISKNADKQVIELLSQKQ